MNSCYLHKFVRTPTRVARNTNKLSILDAASYSTESITWGSPPCLNKRIQS